MACFFSVLIVSATAFLLGSVPFGLVIAKTFCKVDPRLGGSGNVGATNVARLCGFRWGVLTLACDMLKGFLFVLLLATSDSLGSLAYPAGFGVICGHMFSVFLHFKGGKGVAATVGVFLALAPWQLILAGAACLATIWRSGFVSAGSLILVSLLPPLFLVSGRRADLIFSLIVAGLVIYAHRANIRRLLRGEEKAWLVRPNEEA
jgi:glycerol-3-phosphate acyltransferase PlsY